MIGKMMEKKHKRCAKKFWNTRPRGAEELSSRTSPSQPPWNGERHLRPWRPLSSWRRRSTRAFSTCTRWAGDKGDGHLCDFLESEYLGEQVEGIKAIGDLITKMKRAGDGLGLHLIDKEMGS